MKTLVLVLAVVVAVCGAAENIRHDQVVPRQQLVDPIAGAPVPKPVRIVGGSTGASRGQFPYMAALYLNGASFCGGTLISNQWVLTAAHCASGITTFTVYLGAAQLNVNEAGRVVITTRNKVVHSSYSSSTLSNDIALVNLGQSVPFSIYISSVSLASGSATYAGSTARIVGWGRTSDPSSGVSNQLNYVDVTVVSNSVCQATYGSIIVSSTLCASDGNGRSICNGYNGGPLIDVNSGLQIGIVSFYSSAGCNKGYPLGFVRITSFRSWITANTGISA